MVGGMSCCRSFSSYNRSGVMPKASKDGYMVSGLARVEYAPGGRRNGLTSKSSSGMEWIDWYRVESSMDDEVRDGDISGV